VSISFVQEGFLSVDDKLKLEKKNIFVQTEFKNNFVVLNAVRDLAQVYNCSVT